MLRIVFYFLLSTIVTPSLFAQDIIILNSKERVEAKVVEIGLKEVKYKKFSNLDGPLYNVAKSEIFMIMYENGSQESFEEAIEESKPSPSPATSNSQSTGVTSDMLVPTGSYKLSSRDKEKLRKNDIANYEDYNQARTAKAIIGVVGAASSLVVIGTVVVGLANFDKNDTSSSNFNYGPGFYIAGGVSLLSGLLSKGPKRRIKEAYRNHNDDIKRKMNAHSTLKFDFTPTGGFGLVLNF